MLTFQPLESSDLFGFIAGLPMHPLVVHAAVVLLPLSALMLVVLVFVPSWRSRFGWATIAGLAVGTVAAFVAKESGEALAAKVGLPADHARWGDILVPVSVGLFVVALAWLLLRNRAARTSSRSVTATVAGGLAIVLALAATAITVIVGHSGAQAVWAGGVGESPAPSASATATTYTMDDVKAHATPADCWTAIDKTVYNLTAWEGQHPGGQQVIVGLCGTDGTAVYKGEHGSQKKPASALAQFAIGTIGGAKPTASASSTVSATPTATTSATLTLSEVKKHSSASSCWSVVDGEVFDLTKWIGRHPGGPRRILDMCGRDGSAAFHGQHGSSGQATRILDGYSMGKLG
ncbi:MAG TPA: cytochrome b5 domain-containing protein [Propionicimonas sp.]|uniref:cytochrome b5 domain-containing protein n=1 Tax=Propionicimonas sp. TaxID=1955623 RepID=UPI002F42AC80